MDLQPPTPLRVVWETVGEAALGARPKYPGDQAPQALAPHSSWDAEEAEGKLPEIFCSYCK